MKFPNALKVHFTTAKALMMGIQESMDFIERHEKYEIPPEHSYESITRRITQVRQELLQCSKSMRNRWHWE